MRTRQTISIIGDTGNMGSGLAKSLSKGNYRLLLCDLPPEKVTAIMTEIKQETPSADVASQECAFHAAWEADIIILDLPGQLEQTLAEKIKDVANQKMVINLSTSPAHSATHTLQQWLPYSKVVEVSVNPQAAGGAKIPEAVLTGNNPEALQTAAKLTQAAGFRPVIENRQLY